MHVISILYDEGADRAVPLPRYETPGAAGADLRANFGPDVRDDGLTLPAGGRALIPTGLRVSVPDGFEMQIRPRSGLAIRHGITCLNAPGTIDSDYRGPLGVILANFGDAPYRIAHGARIAQAVVAPVVQVRFVQADKLSETARDAGGFGSTGTE